MNIPGMPEGDLRARVLRLATAAKSATWHGLGPDGSMPSDEVFCRAALALIHATEARGPMAQADMLVSLLATSFTPQDADSPLRKEMLSLTLPDPGDAMRESVENNARLFGQPPIADPTPAVIELHSIRCDRCGVPIERGANYCLVRTPDAEVPVHHGCMGGKPVHHG